MRGIYTKTILLFALAISGFVSQAQVNEVMRSSQFGGVTNVSYNPAIADNRFKFDLNLISFGAGVENNYLGLSSFSNQSHYSDTGFVDTYLKERLNGNPKKAFAGTQVQGPLSFMFSWGKNRSNKNAIAISWHNNFIFNVDGVGEEFARSALYGLGSKANSITGFNYQNLTNKNFSTAALAWTDIGATYSRVLIDKGAHMLKAGITGKMVIGIAGYYVSSKNLDYRFRNYDTLDINHSDLNYGHSEIINKQGNFSTSDIVNNLSHPSFAGDLGVVYEWRPQKDKYKYTMDCKEWYRNDVNKYKLAVGFSVVDIGRVKFSKPGDVRNYTANIQGWDVKHAGINSVTTFDSALFHNQGFTADQSTDFSMWLPTRFNIFVDYEIWRGFGANLNSTISPIMASDANQVHYPTSISLTPRYDWKFFGAYLPMSYNEYGNFGVGAGLRLGPLFLTSSNLITVMASNYVYGVNIQGGLKITIPQRKQRDHDKDGVSNKKDKCKKQKGTCASNGCPDRDGDGILDKDDECPDVPGPAETHGCPDRDHDGVYDMNDSCPDVAGSKELHGCPDTDGDGIIDKDDACPTEKGPAATNGCPDRDGDGVADKDDACPDLAGDKAHKGCPDSDEDGLYDNEDKCPHEKGPIENQGCPWPDTDGDGILDKDDACPTVPGVAENHGCPKLEKKELETIKYAFENLEFETGKDVIRTKSYPSLTALAKLLVDKGYGLKIDGHTDNVGKAEMNMDLSRKRAEAVKHYLIDNGVNGSKLETEGYGMTKPIAENKTAEGRQKNRRVEMNILFK